MSYIAKLNLFKSVDDWGPDGAQANTRDIDAWSSSVVADSLDGIKSAIAKWLDNYGMDFAKFAVFDEDDVKPEDGRRFTFCQVEDDAGSPDEDGAYLADYDLRVKLAQSIETPTFGLPVE
jgi:hypothetical protein